MIHKNIIFIVSVTFPWIALAQSNADPQSAYDCTSVRIDHIDKNKLTREERIALMDQALFASVEGYSTCMEKAQSAATESIGSGGGQDDAESGGETESEDQESGYTAEDAALATESSRQEDFSTNGAEDQDVAPKDNDRALCKILYNEISNESNSKKKADLRQAYADYNCD